MYVSTFTVQMIQRAYKMNQDTDVSEHPPDSPQPQLDSYFEDMQSISTRKCKNKQAPLPQRV